MHFRNVQRDLNRKVNDYMRKIVSTMNDITSTTGGGGFIPMADLKLMWDDVVSLICCILLSILLSTKRSREPGATKFISRKVPDVTQLIFLSSFTWHNVQPD